MICAYCFTEMKSGFFMSNGTFLKWEPDNFGLKLLTKELENGLNFDTKNDHPLVKAYICPKCNKLIIDLDRIVI